MKRRGPRAGLLAFVVAFAVTIAACGGGGGGDSASVSIKTLQAAVDNTQAQESSRFVMDVDVDANGEHATIHGEGVTAGDGKTGQITMTVPSAGTIEERIVDGTVYMNFGDLLGPTAGKALGGKQWVKLSLDDLDQQSGGALTGLAEQAGNNGPQQGLEYLQGLSGDVEKIGDDTVAGQHATHYRASIDYAKVAATLPDSAASTRDKLAKLGTVPADVWIDDHDRVVKMHFAIDGGAFGATDGGKVEMAMEITDFGVPVDVQAPPADETVDFSSLTSPGSVES